MVCTFAALFNSDLDFVMDSSLSSQGVFVSMQKTTNEKIEM